MLETTLNTISVISWLVASLLVEETCVPWWISLACRRSLINLEMYLMHLVTGGGNPIHNLSDMNDKQNKEKI